MAISWPFREPRATALTAVRPSPVMNRPICSTLTRFHSRTVRSSPPVTATGVPSSIVIAATPKTLVVSLVVAGT
jgi:hypothetical protein